MRVVADHLRAATFMGSQGLTPSNKLQGYIMRRLLRRAAVRARSLGGNVKEIFLSSIATIIQEYAGAGYISADSQPKVEQVVSLELDKFTKVLERGSREIAKLTKDQITEQLAFDLYQSVGFPFEITEELVAEQGVKLDPACQAVPVGLDEVLVLLSERAKLVLAQALLLLRGKPWERV